MLCIPLIGFQSMFIQICFVDMSQFQISHQNLALIYVTNFVGPSVHWWFLQFILMMSFGWYMWRVILTIDFHSLCYFYKCLFTLVLLLVFSKLDIALSNISYLFGLNMRWPGYEIKIYVLWSINLWIEAMSPSLY